MLRYKIVKMDTEIPEEDVEEYKNFEAILRTHKRAVLGKRIMLSLIPISIIIGSAFYFYPSTGNKATVDIEPLSKKTLTTTDSTQNTNPIDTVVIKIKPVEKLKNKKSIVPKIVIKKEPLPVEVNQQYSFIKATPTYGIDSLMIYLNKELNNKKFAPVKGSLLIAFTIDSIGNSSSIDIIQSLSKEIDNEIIKLIGNMPPWKPAMMNGKPVSTTTTLPIKIEIKAVND